MGDSKSSALDWTLRFKNHNVTVLLLVSPVEPFESLKETLLNALKVRGIKEINGKQVPDDPSDIEFGVPVDRNNLEKGWERLEIPAEDSSNSKNQTGGKKSITNTNPQGADLRDSQAVAFRFRGAGDKGEGESEHAGMDVDEPEWDVLIPAYEDEDEEEE